MKKPLKILAILLGGLLALLAILAVTLTLVFDPNEYKGKIIEMVKDKTGRELRIDGKLGWSFFPWIGIETGKLELGNAPGFGTDPFAHIDAAGAKVELLPLLRKQVVVDTVFLDGLKLNLARNAAGKTNWDDLVKPPTAEQTAEKPAPGKESGIGGVSINKIDIRKADVTWKDQKNGAHYAVHNLDFKTGKIVASKPVDVQLAFDLESGQPPLRTRVDLKSRMNFDLEAQALDVDSLTLALGDLTLQTNFKATHIFDAPAVSGTLEISPFNPRSLMDKLGVKVETAGKTALTKLSLKTKFSATADSIELKDLAINLDDSRLNGSLAVRHFTKPSYQFDLALDQIDLDGYLPPAAPAAASGPKPGTAAPTQPVEVPLSTLRSLAVQGKFHIQKLKAMNLHSSDVVVQVAADNGLITLGPNQAKLYSGKYAGRTTLDVRGKTPTLAIDESVSGVDLAPMLKDALQFDKFTGTANLGTKVTAQGLDARQIKETLNGTAAFAVLNGAIKGIDLKKMTATIEAAKRDKTYQKLTELSPQSGDETRFSQLGGTAQIKNGIVQNNDLKIQSPNLLSISGKGSADLPKETLDYIVSVSSYPIIIDGPFAKLRFRPDWNAILKGKAEEKKTEVKEKFQEKLKERFKLR
ncbi:AsmA family protein [Sulfuricaulis sp.]|jgi:AsmA protein|uniref:AsmA family protein n=1 Tax=Sulfuricaulis sp. TaxID=2003553 RepID=UPI00355AB0AD